MKVRLTKIWESLRANYWFVPSLMVTFAAAIAIGAVAFDRHVQFSEIDLPGWIYAGGAEGARNVLSAIVGAMMSVTSVVFSITIVALTLASGQFGPRLLRNFMSDRSSQFTMGTFVATFVYSLLILRTIRGGEEAFVPQIAATGALVLAILSTGVLIFFIHHIAEQIQADQIVSAVDEDLRRTINRLYPDEFPDVDEPRPDSELPADFDEKCEKIFVSKGDYVQGIDLDGVAKLAAKNDLVIRFTRRPGDFIADGDDIAEVYPRLDDDIHRRIRLLIIMGRTRTPTQDVEYGILQLVEVAVRSLSPGINDPFTAIACIDRLGSSIRRLSLRPDEPPQRHDTDGKLRVVLHATTFDGLFNSAFNQIRQNARGSVGVLIRLLEVITCVAEAVDRPERMATLRAHGSMVVETARRDVQQIHDLADVEERHQHLLETLDRPEKETSE